MMTFSDSFSQTAWELYNIGNVELETEWNTAE